tara:strand:- start:1345 stop:1674 length:330 start_codon:yes stop_codon:yes gene_type:complete
MIVLSLPPTDNNSYGMRGKIKFMYTVARDWREAAHLIAKSQYKGKLQKGDVKIGKITFYLKHWRDIQGSLKHIFDIMEGVVYVNDRQVIEFGKVYRRSDKENPRVEVEV